MRSAVVDLGSCTFHALVADVDRVGVRRRLLDRKVNARIGDALQHGAIIPSEYRNALDRGSKLIDKARSRGVDTCRVVATGAFREATNGRELLTELGERCAVEIELVSGQEEARLTWVGVSSELVGSHGRLAIVDLGGASLEVAVGTSDVDLATSSPLGALRLRGLTPATIRERVKAVLGPTIGDVRASAPETLAMTSGTARALLRLGRRLGLLSELQRYVGVRAFMDLARRIAPLPRETLEVLGVSASRSDTIAGGAVALATVLELIGKPVVYIAESALREGVLVTGARSRRSVPLFAAAGM